MAERPTWHGECSGEAVAVNLILSAALAALAAFPYWQALGPLGRLL